MKVDIATRLHGAKGFTKLSVRNGFWHVALDEESSHLTTFHAPFGRYRRRRLPFGISSAPEVFQPKMHELVKGLPGIEIVAGDFIVAGCRDTVEEANHDHDKVLLMFLERCKKEGVKLITDKLTFDRQKTHSLVTLPRTRNSVLTQLKLRRSARCPHQM